MGTHLAPVKRLIPVMAILVMMIPALGYALGLGNITMNSALNQPLSAEIELFSVERGDLANLAVKLGTEEDFQRVGADRAFFLTKIKFDVVRRDDGTAYVQLSSTKNVTEPFLDFVVEARWPRGRILREFTVLVDPPVLSDEAPTPIEEAAAMMPASSTEAVTSSPAQSPRSAPISSRAELAPVSRMAGELVYGPVKYNDTLWEIANQMRPSGVTVNQMMATLVRENPKAFYQNNANQLKAGYVLRVSDAAALDAMTVATADAEIERQRVEWLDRKSGKLVRQADAPAGGQVARTGETDEGTTSMAADQARLKLVAPGSQGAGSGAGDESINQMRSDLLLAAEALDANRQETDELKTRLTEMEEQLAAMQRLIMLKDDEMLAMQNQLGTEATDTETAMAETPAEEVAETEETTETTEATDAAAEMAMSEDAMDEKDSADAMPAEGIEREIAESIEKAMAEAAMPEQPAAMEEPGLLDGFGLPDDFVLPDDLFSLLDDPMVLIGGVAVLLVIIVVVIQRRRKQRGFEESILNIGGEGSEAGATADSMSGGESSMVSDFAMSEMSGMSGIETDAADVDPISEADVYLAYGRHQQAEDILKEAIEKEPERHEFKLKLLEVSFAAKNREAFEQGAQKFHDALGDESDPMWAKVVTMGSQLCPDNELFGGSTADALKEDLGEMAEAGDDDLLDFDFDMDADSVDTTLAGGDPDTDEMFAELEAATSGDTGLDEFATATTEATEEDTSLDFDMGSDTATDAVTDTVTDTTTTEEDTSLDFDMGTDADVAVATEEPAVASEEKGAEDNSLDFDVSSLDFDLDAGTEDEVATSSDDTGLDFDLAGLEELTESTSEAETETAATDELGDGLGDELTDDVFGEVDEVGTKLDLAKAYVDMGDGDGARSILDEVMEEGDADQKKQAEELLSQLG